MCSICGWQLKRNESLDPEQLSSMSKAMLHRGPDFSGEFIDQNKGIALSHNRLSIIDLSSAGQQPMISDDGSTVLVYNGELYNFIELRSQLEKLGHQFHSQTDSEVILRSFIQWGITCVNHFDGMFAFAVWSAKSNKLFLARDQMGMKPLYYSELPNGGGFIFASEIKAFLKLPHFNSQINKSSLQQFLEFGYIFDEHETSIKNIYKLPPGHFLEVNKGKPGSPESYTSPYLPQQEINGSIHDREKSMYNALIKVIDQHLIADVPVGLLLSGGLDSSIIAAIAARNNKITTLSMGFSESLVDERSYARLVSKYIGSNHIELEISPNEILDNIEEVIWCFDDLFSDWGTLSTRLLYKKCREMGIKVVLVGEGSDEIFGGYPSFETITNNFRPLLWKLFQLYRHYAGRRYGWTFPKFYSIMKTYLAQSGFNLFHAIRLFESRNQLPNNYVMKVDKASMSVSVEARTPFLDRRITELAYQIPGSDLLKKGTNKYILRSMSEQYSLLPKEITDRPKYGASIAASWMDDSIDFREYSKKILFARDGWVDQLGLRNAMESYFSGEKQGYSFPHAISIFNNLSWRLLLLNLWSKKYLSETGSFN